MSEYKKIITQNKKASFQYFIEEKFEAGIILVGSEVKSIRDAKVMITDTHAAMVKKELFLYNCYIAEYKQANQFNHSPTRPRKLLLKKKEIQKIIVKTKLKGYTLVALSMYFNKKNIAKVEIGLSKGKKQHDKRQAIKEKDWGREQGRILKNKNNT